MSVSQANASISLINAQSAVDDAQTALANLKVLPTQSQIDSAYATYLADQQTVAKLKAAFDKVSALTEDDLRRAQALSDLEAALQTKNKDEATYNYLENYQPDASSVTQAEANLELAKAQLTVAQADNDAVKNGPDETKIAAAQANIQEIEATLDQQYIRAPFAGTITSVSVAQGDVVSNGVTAFTINDLSKLYLDLQVSEVDINSVAQDQPVDLTFDAIADNQYRGQVTDIGMIGTVSGGVANFTVTAVMTDPDDLVRPGMTASATIITEQASSVLLVPNNAVTTLGGGKAVYILSNGQLNLVRVTTGLSSDTQAEVSSDSLAAGDLVVTNPSSLSIATTTNGVSSVFSNLFQMLGVTSSGGGGTGGFGAGGTPPDFNGGNPPSGFPPSGGPSGAGG